MIAPRIVDRSEAPIAATRGPKPTAGTRRPADQDHCDPLAGRRGSCGCSVAFGSREALGNLAGARSAVEAGR